MKLTRYITAMAAVAAMTIAVSCSNKQSAEANQTDATEQTAEAEEPAEAVRVLKAGETLPANSDVLVVVDFNATWCGPCRAFGPIFDSVAEQFRGKARFYSVDVDQNPELAAQFGVESIPYIVLIKPDGTTDSFVGYKDEPSFAAIVASNL